jgi:hypothetical protein
MADKNKGASLAPEDHAGGGSIPDGDYVIKESYAGLFTYAGVVPEGVPAIMVLYRADDGSEYEQPYKAGDNEHLVPSDDGERFLHPQGEEARIYKGGAASMWLGSLAKAGFKINGDSVKQFKGTRVTLVNTAAPKGRDGQGKDKVIPLVSKVLGTAKGPGPKAVATVPAKTVAATTTPAPAASNGNSDIDATARDMILTILASAPDNTITRVKLSTDVLLTATKNPNLKAHNTALKKLAGDSAWLIENASVGGWSTDGETIQLGGN